MDVHIIEAHVLLCCENYISGHIQSLHVFIFISVLFQCIGLFIGEHYNILTTVQFDAVFQLNHLLDVVEQLISERIRVLGDEIGAVGIPSVSQYPSMTRLILS